MAEVTMTIEEYLDLIEKTTRAGLAERRRAKTIMPKRTKKKGKKDPKMSRALKRANDWGRTKSGKLRKGVSQGDIMRKAHAYRRKM
jgi:hypothetical protein